MGITLGLSIRDIDDMTIGLVIDLLYMKVNQMDRQKEEQKDNRRKATQADYDTF